METRTANAAGQNTFGKVGSYAFNVRVRRTLNKQWRQGLGKGNVAGHPIPGEKSDAYYARVNRRIDRRNQKRIWHNKQVEQTGRGRTIDLLPYVQNPRTYVPPVELAAPKPKRARKPKTGKVKIILGDK